MFKRTRLLAAFVLIAGCVNAPPAPAPVPLRRPAPAPRPVAPPPAAAADRPFTPGSWSYANGVARFAEPTLFEARCDRAAGRVVLTATGAGSTGGGASAMTLRASTTARTVPASATATGTSAGTVAQIAVTDTILDAMAFSRGSFTVQAGTTVLTLPAWPQFTRVIEDCRG